MATALWQRPLVLILQSKPLKVPRVRSEMLLAISANCRAIREAFANEGWRFVLVSSLQELKADRNTCRTLTLPVGSESDSLRGWFVDVAQPTGKGVPRSENPSPAASSNRSEILTHAPRTSQESCVSKRVVRAGLDVDYEGSNRNADILIEHFQTIPVTVAAVYQLVEQRKNEFIWRTSAQFNWDKASVSLTLEDRQRIIDYVNRSQHLKSDGDNLYVNATAFAKWITAHKVPVQNLESMVPQIVQSPYRLVTKTLLQDSEREAKAARQAAQQQRPKNTDDEVKIPAGLPAYLHEHYRQTHSKAQAATPSTPTTPQSHFESLARDAVASIQSNVDRSEAERLLTKAGAWGWELVCRNIESFIQRRKQQRWLAGR